ncbi:MAG TPA: SirB2 family protein [Candidatus Didemnitutus sp.]|nr:SirB2 family protein [Candidatus Didemnitutus sp.]
MNPQFYYVLHVFSLIVLTAHTYMAFANPDPVNKKSTMIVTGIASLLMLVSGFGLYSKVYQNVWPGGWLAVKIVCWLGLSALAGLAYRKAHLRGLFSFLGLVFVLIALVMVYFKPF